jgi:hypothetical protein
VTTSPTDHQPRNPDTQTPEPDQQQPLEDFAFSINAIWADWTRGRLSEEDAMTAIAEALTELRERRTTPTA